MRGIAYHRLIQQDLQSALDYYESESGIQLAERFFAEVEAALRSIEANPERNHFSNGSLRRVTLRSFPYHFLYAVDAQEIWIAVLRHDRRHPNFGLRRQKGDV